MTLGTAELILPDTLWPPAPDQLVADCRALGAAGCWVYAARRNAAGADIGIGGWTPAHVVELHAAGLVAPAIIVPGSSWGDVGPMLDAADALGCDPPTAFDLEAYSLPSWAWLQSAIAATRARGRRPLRYGDEAVLAGYPPADGDWWSHGAIPVRAGSWKPVPALPDGLVADQYAVEVLINGHSYDVSVADPGVFGGQPVIDQNRLNEIDNIAGAMDRLEHLADAPGDVLQAIKAETDQVRDSLANLQVGGTGITAAQMAAALRAAAHQLDGQ